MPKVASAVNPKTLPQTTSAMPAKFVAPAGGFTPAFHRLFDPVSSRAAPAMATTTNQAPPPAQPPASTRLNAAQTQKGLAEKALDRLDQHLRPPQRMLPQKGLAEKALESTLLTIVEGANQATRSMAAPVSKALRRPDQRGHGRLATRYMAAPVSKAMAWKQADAAKADASPGTKNPIGWKAAWERAKDVIKQTADKAIAVADENSQHIRPKLSMPELAAARVIGMGPELLLSGPSKARVVANRVVSAVQNYGQNQSIAGAIGELAIPGNSVVGNIASNVVVDTLAGLDPFGPPPPKPYNTAR